MGLIDKVYKIVKTANSVVDLSNKINGSELLKGLNLQSFNINNFGSVGSGMESMLSGISSDITSGLNNVVNVDELKSMAESITPKDVGIDLGSIDTGIDGFDLSDLGINNGLDVGALEDVAKSITPESMGIDFGSIDTGIDGFDLGNFGLDNINFM